MKTTKKLQLARETIQALYDARGGDWPTLNQVGGGSVSRAFMNCTQSGYPTCYCGESNTCVGYSAHGTTCLEPTVRD